MDRFHDENDISPFDLIGGKWDFGIVGKTCGIGLHAWMLAENSFRRGAAELVTGAKKKDAPHPAKMIVAGSAATPNFLARVARVANFV